MPLADVFPREAILQAVPTALFQDFKREDFEAFAQDEPNTAMTFGFAAWDHALSCGEHDDLDPQSLAGPIDAGDPLLIRHVAAALGRDALFDFTT